VTHIVNTFVCWKTD